MKLIYKYLLATVLCIFFVVAAQAQSYRINSASGANVRKGPGTDQPILTKIPQGATVKVVERTNGNWVKVEYNGQTGYVASELVKKDNGQSSNNRQPSSSSDSKSKGTSTSNRPNSAATNKNIGLGLRFGDPAGITFKKYSGNTAWEVNLGSSYRWGYRYEDRFYRYDRFEDRKYMTIKATVPVLLRPCKSIG